MQAPSTTANSIETMNLTSTEGIRSAVSWGPIFAGAFAAIGLSLVLLSLGSGLGLLTVSPWSNTGASATGFTVMTGIWIIIVQWLSSALGGYMTGRLRTKYVRVHTDEVYFRDTAHGFLAWAVASVIAVAIVVSAASSLVSGSSQVVTSIASGAAQGMGQGVSSSDGAMAYLTDTLFRSDNPNGTTNDDVVGEASRILMNRLKDGDVSADDRAYLARVVATRTGISQPEAEKRVDQAISKVKEIEVKARDATDAARKAGAYFSLFTAISMIIGAFIAAVAGALGGRHRDDFETYLSEPH